MMKKIIFSLLLLFSMEIGLGQCSEIQEGIICGGNGESVTMYLKGLGTSYYWWNGYCFYSEQSVGSDCGPYSETPPLPLSDGLFPFLFLGSGYGIFLYRRNLKRKSNR